MSVFKFKYSHMIWILLSCVCILCTVGLVFNIIDAIAYFSLGTFKFVGHICTCILNAFILVFVISVMVNGKYVIKDGALYLRFGFIYVKNDIKEIVQITHFKKSDALVMYFVDQKFSVAVIHKKDYDNFVLALRKENPNIFYDKCIEGEDLPNN